MKNPLEAGLVLLGATAMVIATFLPLNESPSYRRIEENSMIQQGGWMLIVVAIGVAVSGYYLDQGKRSNANSLIVLCLIAAAIVFFVGSSEGTQTLYPINPDGTPDTTAEGVKASMGIGIYLAGVGAVMSFIGGLMLRGRVKAPHPGSERSEHA